MTISNKNTIVWSLSNLAVGIIPSSSMNNVCMPKRRKLLIFLNPFSCNGRATRVWRQAKIILDKAYIEQEFIETERAGHAYDYVNTEDLSQYVWFNKTSRFDGIISVSGDGLVHEIVNGFLNRKENLASDKSTPKLIMPIGVIPGGSSDGLHKALAHESGESHGVEQACLMVSHHLNY